MPTSEQLRDKLIEKLKELFQLDQPDLDFGFYRLMHVKSKEVTEFLETTLPTTIKDAFGGVSDARRAELQAAYDTAVATAKSFGVPDPEKTEPVMKAKEALDAVSGNQNDEKDIYDHLYRFFERYYDKGDFISNRILTRETAGKSLQYAIPYSGEEVKLHWANADQYYIKTSESFNEFSFDLTQAPELAKIDKNERILKGIPNEPINVTLKLVDAAEGEHGNVKASDDKKRSFFLTGENPVAFTDSSLEVHFEYRLETESDAIDARQEAELKERFGVKNKGDMKTLAMAEVILKAVDAKIKSALAAKEDTHRLEALSVLLNWPAPTDNIPQRPLIVKYLNKYTAKNTSDYFIHKNLNAFLRRELDFYIKNEIMQLDNIEAADAPHVESYLGKIKVFRKIAGQVIAFLAQLENFQKKMWLKKKFVIQADYCVTLDRVPAEFYPEIFANEKQKDEWHSLGFPDELLIPPVKGATQDGELISDNENWTPSAYLMVDTQFFPQDFKERLMEAIPDLDAQCNGLLVHSENFQALRLLQERYREQIKCIYIDPPYNTGNDDFIYKDQYQHSSWLTMMYERIHILRSFLSNNGLFLSSIADQEIEKLRFISDMVFNRSNMLANFIWNNEGNIDNQSKVKCNHEYILGYCKSEKDYPHAQVIAPDIEENSKLYNETIENSITKNGPANPPSEVELPAGFPATIESGTIPARESEWPHLRNDIIIQNSKLVSAVKAYSGWSSRQLLDEFISNGCKTIVDSKGLDTWFKVTNTGAIYIYKSRKNSSHVLSVIRNVGTVKKTGIMLENMGFSFAYPKPVLLIEYILNFNNEKNALCLDCFAGSGTLGHAAINLHRKGINKQYVLVEMGKSFDEILKPRMKEVVFSEDWKDKSPVPVKKTKKHGSSNEYNGISQCFKYIRLESYEDTLNNIVFQDGRGFEGLSDYRLKYMLDVESRGSKSLLNLEAFANPFEYTLKVKKACSDESDLCKIDLAETFNYLIGLRVDIAQATQAYDAEFERLPDPDLPEDQHTRLTIKGRLHHFPKGKWKFRCIKGTIPKNRFAPNDGGKERVLIIWRNLTGNLEEDNAVLDEYCQHERISTLDNEADIIYVNGSNNLPNLKRPKDTWKVRLIEEDFLARMWEEDDNA